MVILYVTLASYPALGTVMGVTAVNFKDGIIDMRDDNDNNNWQTIKDSIYSANNGILEETIRYQVTPNMFKYSNNLNGVLEDPTYKDNYSINIDFLSEDWLLHFHKEIT